MAGSYPPPSLGHILEEVLLPDVNTTINLFGIHLRQVSGSWDYPMHEHPQFEINYLLEGEQLMKVEGVPLHQHAGDLLVIRPGQAHSSRSANSELFTYFCIHFSIDDPVFLSMLGRLQQTLFLRDSALTRQVEPMLARLIAITRLAGTATMAQRMRLHSAIFDLFGALWEAVSQEADTLSGSYVKVELAHQIRSRLQGLASQHFKQGIPLERHYGIDDIAAELGISTSHCSRVFRQVYGTAPRMYLSELVLQEAKMLLSNSLLSIEQISSVLGYKDIAHFSRQFKRWTGSSPSEYRRLHAQGEQEAT
ncbi:MULTISPECIES: helix-turn-helix domain-containing protein [Paenibacillus]|uniref:helix-turn-helix domain-containing protein n=1 Tax=Paenibacillus TaxID=44249 RepID=UPI0022B88FC6|nr:AraC family transcriptional regulator [Paenibacillus caseinilyticus]MCZ8523946.1 AraC family transcriptional regulator [Paenibacillus caseinilyticus]